MNLDASRMEANRWNHIFDLLSLDGVVPLYEEMGLQISDKQQFMALLRRLIAESREKLGAGRTPDIEFAKRVLSELERQFGESVAEHFYRWATTIFWGAPSDQPFWSAWKMTLPRHSDQLPKGSPAEWWLPFAEFKRATDIDDIEERVTTLRAQPLSTWDAQLYAINEFSNVEDPLCRGGDFSDPYSPITATIEMNRMQMAWPELWSHFTEEQKDLFVDLGRRMLKDEDVDKNLPGPLPHPDELRRQV